MEPKAVASERRWHRSLEVAIVLVLAPLRAALERARLYALEQAAVASHPGRSTMQQPAIFKDGQAPSSGCVLLQHAGMCPQGHSEPRLGEQHVARVPMQEGEHEYAPASVWQAKACGSHEPDNLPCHTLCCSLMSARSSNHWSNGMRLQRLSFFI